MTTKKRKIPPPPGWERRPHPYEMDALKFHGRTITNSARWCAMRTRGRLEFEDTRVDLQETLVVGVRRFAATNDDAALPRPLGTTIIRRRAMNLLRPVGYAITPVEDLLPRQRFDDDDLRWEAIFASGEQNAEEQQVQGERQEVYDALTYLLRRNLSPAGFAILHLRHIEEFTAPEIAKIVQSRGKRDAAKRHARAFLQTLGIHEWQDVEALTPEDVHE